jgi:hypothetical protein
MRRHLATLVAATAAPLIVAAIAAGAAHAQPKGTVHCTARAVGSQAQATCTNTDDGPGDVALAGMCSNGRPFYQADVPIGPRSTITLREDCGPGQHPTYQNAWGASQYQQQHSTPLTPGINGEPQWHSVPTP